MLTCRTHQTQLASYIITDVKIFVLARKLKKKDKTLFRKYENILIFQRFIKIQFLLITLTKLFAKSLFCECGA